MSRGISPHAVSEIFYDPYGYSSERWSDETGKISKIKITVLGHIPSRVLIDLGGTT